MGYEDKDFEIIKQKDGSLIEKVGSVETLYKRPFIPWWVEVQEITYSQTLYNPEGEEDPFGVEDENRGTDPYFNPEIKERFRCKGHSELSRVCFFGEKGGRGYDITIIPLTNEDKRLPRVYMDVFKNEDNYSVQKEIHSLEVHIEQEVFNNLKDLYLQQNLKILKLSINFSEGKDIYHDQNLDSDIVFWKILNESDESSKTVEGRIRRLDCVSHLQSLSGFKPGEKY